MHRDEVQLPTASGLVQTDEHFSRTHQGCGYWNLFLSLLILVLLYLLSVFSLLPLVSPLQMYHKVVEFSGWETRSAESLRAPEVCFCCGPFALPGVLAGSKLAADGFHSLRILAVFVAAAGPVLLGCSVAEVEGCGLTGCSGSAHL